MDLSYKITQAIYLLMQTWLIGPGVFQCLLTNSPVRRAHRREPTKYCSPICIQRTSQSTPGVYWSRYCAHILYISSCNGLIYELQHKIASSMAGINISRASLSNQRAATDALSNSSDVSAPLRQSNISRTEKSPAKHYVQLPILSSYADATNVSLFPLS